jgi:hypothetical protein
MTDEPQALIVARVEDISVLPRTLEIKPEQMKLPGADATIYPVYGKDINDRRVWVATFCDADEAQVWIQSSKMFGRPITGYVMAGQVKKEPEGPKLVDSDGTVIKGGEMSDGAMAIGNEGSGPAGKPS